ncbi:peptide-methionine (R)-S-oxide reductase MsrB [Candidatus Uhrbacteria bacterium]|nr:peptide-methionine (R)-S-oxide reductase MsrB [Candidatus Uhrbacteria bacterium]
MSDTKYTNEEWRKKLTPEQYRILREKGTEPAFTGKYWNCDAKGIYCCAACGSPLFSSDAKFESGTGWPSFTDPLVQEAIDLREDASHGLRRTEVVCRNCGGHLGHVFKDGPHPGGKRFCINSCSLDLQEH